MKRRRPKRSLIFLKAKEELQDQGRMTNIKELFERLMLILKLSLLSTQTLHFKIFG